MFWVLKKTLDEFMADNCFRMAAALAYHAIFALAPLLVLVISILGLVVDPDQVSGEVERQLSQFIGIAGAEQVRLMIGHIQESRTSLMAAILSGLAVLLGAAGLMYELQSAINEAWKVERPSRKVKKRSLILKRLLSFLLLIPIVLLLLLSMLASAAITAFTRFSEFWAGKEGAATIVWVTDFATVFVIYVVVFAIIFKYLPDTHVAWRHALAGGIFTAICFIAGRYAFGAYLGSQDMGATYGAGGAVVTVLLWIYYASAILLLGTEFTQVWSEKRRSELRVKRPRVDDEPAPVPSSS